MVTNLPSADLPLDAVRFNDDSVVDIGGLQSQPELELRVRGSHDAMRLPDGGVLVSNGFELRRYSTAGVLERSVGRQGGGPGEFQSLVWGLCRTTYGGILAIEVPTPRVGVTDPKLEKLRTVGYSGRAIYRGCTRDGFLAAIGEMRVPGGDGPSMRTVGRFSRDGSLRATLGDLPGDDYSTIFPHEATIAASGDVIAVGATLATEYRIYRPNGGVARIVRTRDTERTMSRAGVEQIVRWRLGAGAAEDLFRSEVDRMMAGRANVPVPAVMRLNVDETGRVWLAQLKELGAGLETWTVFDSTGRLLGRADPNQALPRGSEGAIAIRWTANDFVVKYRDADGALHIRLVPYVIHAASLPVVAR